MTAGGRADRESRTGPATDLRAQARGSSPGTTTAAITLLTALALVIAGLVAYRSSFAGAFVLDDGPAISLNSHIKALWPLSRAMSAPPEVTVAGRPVVSLSLALNYALAPADVRDVLSAPGPASPAGDLARYRRNLWGYHAMNVTIHVLAGLALFGVVRRTLAAVPAVAPRATPLALITALIWVVHPLQTGSVTYVVQRAESLMGLFVLLTLYCAIRAHGPGRRWWAVASVAACAAGMATKEVTVVAPLLVLLWDWLFGRRPPESADTAPRWTLYAGLSASWLLLAWLMWNSPRPESVGFGFDAWPWWRYLATQAGVVLHYVRLSLVPAPLVLDYGWSAVSSVAVAAGPVLLVSALVAGAGWLTLRRHPLAYPASWVFVILAPTSSVVPIVTEVAAEHRMYLPLAGVLVLVVLGVDAIIGRLAASRRLAVGGALVAVATVTLVTLTDARNRDYSSEESLWRDTVEKRPDNARAHNNYAVSLLQRGEYDLAASHLRRAIALDPDFAGNYGNLGVALCRTGACAEGVTYLERALQLEPSAKRLHRDLGEAHGSLGRDADALRHFLAAIDAAPEDVFLLNRAGWLLATSSDPNVRSAPRAVALAERAVRLTGRRDETSLDTLAAGLAASGRRAEAALVGAEALERAKANGNHALVPELEQRLASYR